MECKHKSACVNYNEKCAECNAMSDLTNHYPCFKNTEWITDRLPKDFDNVLCWYEYFRYGDYNRMYQTYGIGYCINGQWCGEVANGVKCRVIAWQPLPKPPMND